MFGFLNINKPPGITAFDVVARVRKILSIKRVGHAGTLDPMATGVLPVALGKACRLIRFLDGTKTYRAEILLGTQTDTDDITGRVIEQRSALPDAEEVVRAAAFYSGELDQVPPAYSAVHYQGKRLYELARAGKAPEDIECRRVCVHEFQIEAVALPVVHARITCSAGTYIRSIARDLGKQLGCGGCLQKLERTAAGPFTIERSFTLDELADIYSRGDLASAIYSPAEAIGLPSIALEREQARLLTLGQSLVVSADLIEQAVAKLRADFNSAKALEHIVVTYAGELIAVCRQTAQNYLSPEVVIAHAE